MRLDHPFKKKLQFRKKSAQVDDTIEDFGLKKETFKAGKYWKSVLIKMI